MAPKKPDAAASEAVPQQRSAPERAEVAAPNWGISLQRDANGFFNLFLMRMDAQANRMRRVVAVQNRSEALDELNRLATRIYYFEEAEKEWDELGRR